MFSCSFSFRNIKAQGLKSLQTHNEQLSYCTVIYLVKLNLLDANEPLVDVQLHFHHLHKNTKHTKTKDVIQLKETYGYCSHTDYHYYYYYNN